MLRNQDGWCIRGWCTWNLALRDRSTKEMSGRSLRGRSAQAQVQVRGYKEEKLGLAVRTLCFICPSYRSYNRSRHPHFLSRRNFSRCVCNCNVLGCIRASFFPAFPAELFDKLDSPLTRQRIPRRWVVMWALVCFFFCPFFLIISLSRILRWNFTRLLRNSSLKLLSFKWNYFTLIMARIIMLSSSCERKKISLAFYINRKQE